LRREDKDKKSNLLLSYLIEIIEKTRRYLI
jgi:hypothetical protein